MITMMMMKCVRINHIDISNHDNEYKDGSNNHDVNKDNSNNNS